MFSVKRNFIRLPHKSAFRPVKQHRKHRNVHSARLLTGGSRCTSVRPRRTMYIAGSVAASVQPVFSGPMDYGAESLPIFDGLASGIVPDKAHGRSRCKTSGVPGIPTRQDDIGITARPGRIMFEPTFENRATLGLVFVERVDQIPLTLLHLRTDPDRSAVQRHISPAVVMDPRKNDLPKPPGPQDASGPEPS